MNAAKKFSECLRDCGVNRLFYMAAADNLESILQRGICCHIDAAKLPHVKISDPNVQQHRADFHRHVPLFFADNTPMLYNVCDAHPDVVLLEISTAAADCGGIYFADGNAASHDTAVYENPKHLKKLDWEIVLSHNSATGTDRHGRNWIRIRSAEMLIPAKCPAHHIQGVYFQKRLPEDLRAKLREILDNSPHEIFLKPSLTPQGIPVGNKPQPTFLA